MLLCKILWQVKLNWCACCLWDRVCRWKRSCDYILGPCAGWPQPRSRPVRSQSSLGRDHRQDPESGLTSSPWYFQTNRTEWILRASCLCHCQRCEQDSLLTPSSYHNLKLNWVLKTFSLFDNLLLLISGSSCATWWFFNSWYPSSVAAARVLTAMSLYCRLNILVISAKIGLAVS